MENVLYELTFPLITIIEYIVVMIIAITLAIVLITTRKRKAYLLSGVVADYTTTNPANGTKKVIEIVIASVLASFIPLALIISYVYEYNQMKIVLDSDEYLIIEGFVEDFTPMPKKGHQNESFYIDGILFEYSDFNGEIGYNKTYHYGGVIRGNGQQLKIAYYEKEDSTKVILKITEISEFKEND